MQLSHARSKKPNMPSVIAPTNPNTIDTLLDTVKQIVRSTLLDWKPSRVNYAPTHLNVLTAKVIIRWTLTSIFFWKHRFNYKWHAKKY